MIDFKDFFRAATKTAQEPQGREPYPYQIAFATGDSLPELLNVPTGVGKTATALLGWLYRRRVHPNEYVRRTTPRRLVYCLPMRVLVEQTSECATAWIASSGLTEHVNVHLLMGGADATQWDEHPERDAILIGTQDMLLSRALNRGHAARRPRWPVEFELLHSDCLWVFDEVQLMGCGLATTAQLAAFANKMWKPAMLTRFLWMSATLGDSFLQTRDRRDWDLTKATRRELSQEDFDEPAVQTRLQASKTLHVIKDRAKAAKILEAHPRGRISLVMLNTVPVAKSVYAEVREELAKPVGKNKPKGPQPEVCLLHSRFRQMDRERQMERLLVFLKKMDATGAVPDSDGLIVVSTQVLEAGFDLSSARLWSEIAPWPSVIQRLGRLNREGLQPDATASFWMPKTDDGNKGDDRPNAKRVGPYEKKALDSGKKLIESVIAKQTEGLAYRDALDAVLLTEESQSTLIVEP